MTNPNIILVTIPKKNNDPTMYTSQWGESIVKAAYDLGYKIVTIRGDEVDYDTVTSHIYQYRPRLYLHVGHGCVTNLMGQGECIITTGVSNDTSCKPMCSNYPNIEMLEDTMVVTIACYSSRNLGRVAVANGTTSYTGYDDIMLFPVDNRGSQNLFRDVHLTFIRNLLSGDSVAEAERKMEEHEDYLISKYKDVKYISLPLLWNKLHRENLGNMSDEIW